MKFLVFEILFYKRNEFISKNYLFSVNKIMLTGDIDNNTRFLTDAIISSEPSILQATNPKRRLQNIV